MKLKHIACHLTTLLLLQGFINAQVGQIAGNVVDAQTGEGLPGAIVLVEGSARFGQSDMDGNFVIRNVPAGNVTVVVSYVSYLMKKIGDVQVKSAETVELSLRLEPANSSTLEGVEIVTSLNRETSVALMLERRNNRSVSDGVSAEIIKRTPDRSTSDVFKRVSGASIQDNRFAIVRGLNERYNAAYLNGAPLPSTESDHKAFSFDIFPSSMLDNLLITKSASADMPGEFAGGIIDIRTKSIPEKNFVSLNAGTGYNTITTFRTRLYAKHMSRDGLGLKGNLALPPEIPGFHDFTVDVHQQAAYAKQVPLSDWNTYSGNFSPNHSFLFSAGANLKRREKDFFGIIAALSYNRSNTYFSTDRYVYLSGKPNDVSDPLVTDKNFQDKTYQSQLLSSALLNLGLKLNAHHSFALRNMISANTDDRLIARSGVVNAFDKRNPDLIRSNAFWYTQNVIRTSQLSGDHYLPKAKVKLNWTGGLSQVRRDIPNLRRTVYFRKQYIDTLFPEDPSEPPIIHPMDTVWQAQLGDGKSSGPDYAGVFLFAHLKETIESLRLDVSKTWRLHNEWQLEGKTGAFYQHRARNYEMRQFAYSKYGVPGGTVTFDDSLSYLSEGQLFTAQNMGLLAPGKGGLKLVESTQPQEAYYMAASFLSAAYSMVDLRYKSWFRFSGGLRYESYRQNLAYPSKLFYFNNEYISSDTTFNDLLPSANLILAPGQKHSIRLAYSKTVNRPEFREIAPLIFYDFNTGYSLKGDPGLIRARISNYDLRYEFFPGGGQLISASAFKKDFADPIELIQSENVNEIIYRNVPRAEVRGLEFEYRIGMGIFFKSDSSCWSKVLSRLTLFSNASLIHSQTDVLDQNGNRIRTRRMQGQSPYLINGGLSYIDREHACSFSAMVNRVGPRIYVAGNYLLPEIWENARTVLDLQLTKSFFKDKLEIRFNIKDALARKQLQLFYQNFDDNIYYNEARDAKIWLSRYGTQYSFVIAFRF